MTSKQPGSYVYVISATHADHFAEMAAVSMASLRILEPKSIITAVIEGSSDYNNGIIAIEKLSTRVIRIDTGLNDRIYQSRLLKVNLRNIIEGDFLYIDSDAFVLKPLNEIWSIQADIAAAPDISTQGQSYSTHDTPWTNVEGLNWSPYDSTYLNSGVFLLRDKPICYEFAQAWHAGWLEFCNVVGKGNDQPSFNNALNNIRRKNDRSGKALGVSFRVLPQIWNAQITMSERLGRNAKIAHVFSGDFNSRNDTVVHVAAKQLKITGVIDSELINSAIQSGHIWSHLDSPGKLYGAGKYIKSFYSKFEKIFDRRM